MLIFIKMVEKIEFAVIIIMFLIILALMLDVFGKDIGDFEYYELDLSYRWKARTREVY